VVTLLVFAALRVAWGHGSPRVYPDSESYETLALTGVRLWTVPAIYELVPSDAGRVAFQVGFGVFAWVLTTVLLAHCMTTDTGKAVVTGAVSLLGITPHVTQWDSVILSESITVSLLVLLVALVAYVVRRRPGWPWMVALVVVVSLFAYTRHVNVFLVGLAAALLLIAAAVMKRKQIAIVGMVFVLIAGLGMFGLAQSEGIRSFNTNSIISDRILADGHIDFLIEHGMPPPTDRMQSVSGDFVGNESVYLDNAELQTWIEDSWAVTYAKYLLSHPQQALIEPLQHAPRLWSKYDHYGPPSQGVLQNLRAHLFITKEWILVVVLVAVGLLACLRTRHRDHGSLDAVAAGCVLTAFVLGFLVWHLAATELERLSLPAAVLLRLGLILYVVSAVDRRLARSRAVHFTDTTTVVRGDAVIESRL
jgi:hypothetical protein